MRTLGIRDISTGEISGKDPSMKMGMKAMPGGKTAQSVECDPMGTIFME